MPRYLKLMQTVMVQLNSWSRVGIEQRDDACRETDELFWDLGFRVRRFEVPLQYSSPSCANVAASCACHWRGASLSTSPTPRLCKSAPLANERKPQWG